MALNLGTLVAYLKADDTALARGLAGAQQKVRGWGEGAKAAAAAAGAATAAAISAGIAQNLDLGAGRAKLAAQLDLTKGESARIGSVAGKVYANNFGDSLDSVNDAIRAVGQNLGDVSKMSSADLQQVTQSALAVASAFDVDVNDATRAAGKLITSGLAKNSAEAFDIVTKGFQSGLNASGDFLDTLNEYGPQFSKLGIDGPRALALLKAGLSSGARDTDAIADAFKEFSIRAIDGSTTTAAGFKALGLDAKEAAAQIGKGGPAAASMTQTVLSRLLAIKDPIEQNAAGVALFGTQWEDTVRQTLPALARAKSGMDGVTGATQRMADTAGGSGKAKIETLRRSVEQWIQTQTSSSSAVGTTVAAVAAFGSPALAMAGSLGSVVTALTAMNVGAAASAVWGGAVRAATLAWTGAQWLLNVAMSANPLGLVVIAIVALVAAIVYAWRNSETFRRIVTGAFGAVWGAIKAVWQWLKGNWPLLLAILTGPVGLAVRWIVQHWDQIVSTAKAIPEKVRGVFAGVGNLLKDAGRRLIQGLIDGIKAQFGAVKGTLGWLTDAIGGWKGPESVDRKLLTGNGRLIIGGLLEGLESQYPTVQRSLSGFTAAIAEPDLRIPAPRLPGTRAPSTSGVGRAPVVVTLRVAGDREAAAFIKRLVRVEGGGSVVAAFES